ncbi:MAG: Holliday junction resolvase RuvX [Phycisphaeraceae bacterium]
MRYLAIDLGDKRTGLAVGDDVTGIASPLAVIATANAGERLRQLARIIDEQGPDALVLGLPVNMDGTHGPAAKKSQAFALELRRRFGLPVHSIDERLTSHAADALMSRSGLTRKGKKERRDALAAAVLLRDFLENKKR